MTFSSDAKLLRRLAATVVLMVVAFSPAAAAPPLTDRDVQLAAEAASLIVAGSGERLALLLERGRVSPDRLEQIIGAVFLIIADIQLGEAEEQVGRRDPAAAAVVTSEGRRIRIRPVNPRDLRAGLAATRKEVRSALVRLFPDDDRALAASREMVLRNRAVAERVFNLLQGQEEQREP